MSRTNWSIYVLQSGGTWADDGTIYVPNNPQGLLFPELSTQQKVKLADGSNAFIRPETFYEKMPLTLIWINVDVDFVVKIQDYLRGSETVKIVTNISGREYIGRFIDFQPTWITGDTDVYDLEVTFERMDEAVSLGGLTMATLIDLLIFGETPTPATNGAQTVFTVANSYVSGTLRVFRNGQLLYEGIDYTETASTTFTLTVAPDSSEYLRVDYIKDA